MSCLQEAGCLLKWVLHHVIQAKEMIFPFPHIQDTSWCSALMYGKTAFLFSAQKQVGQLW